MTIRFLLVLAAVIVLVVDGLALLAGVWGVVDGLAVACFALAAYVLATLDAAARRL